MADPMSPTILPMNCSSFAGSTAMVCPPRRGLVTASRARVKRGRRVEVQVEQHDIEHPARFLADSPHGPDRPEAEPAVEPQARDAAALDARQQDPEAPRAAAPDQLRQQRSPQAAATVILV